MHSGASRTWRPQFWNGQSVVSGLRYTHILLPETKQWPTLLVRPLSLHPHVSPGNQYGGSSRQMVKGNERWLSEWFVYLWLTVGNLDVVPGWEGRNTVFVALVQSLGMVNSTSNHVQESPTQLAPIPSPPPSTVTPAPATSKQNLGIPKELRAKHTDL
jgi:hypothetical protein